MCSSPDPTRTKVPPCSRPGSRAQLESILGARPARSKRSKTLHGAHLPSAGHGGRLPFLAVAAASQALRSAACAALAAGSRPDPFPELLDDPPPPHATCPSTTHSISER